MENNQTNGSMPRQLPAPDREQIAARVIAADLEILDRRNCTLPDRESVERLIREISNSLATPTPEKLAVAAVAKLLDSWPANRVPSPDGYRKAMVDELVLIPPDIVVAAVRLAIRRLKFVPSVAEMIEICGELISERQTTKRAAERVLREHSRRVAQEQRRAEEAKREIEEARRLASIVREVNSAREPTDDQMRTILHFAVFAEWRRYSMWIQAIMAKERWACAIVIELNSVVAQWRPNSPGAPSRSKIYAEIVNVFDEASPQ